MRVRGGLLPSLALATAALAACVPGAGPEGPSPARGLPALPALPSPARSERLLLVTVHGFSPGAYLEPGAGRMVTVAALAAAGAAAEAVTPVFPPSAYPAHTSLVTGRMPARHGIPADHLLGDRGVRPERYEHASRVRSRTLWQAVSESGRPAAAIDWPATGGASIAGLLPDKLPLRRGESWTSLLADSATPWLFELARAAGADSPQAARPGPERDAVLARVACGLLESQAPPSLLLLRLSQTERALRRFGPGTPEAHAAFVRADRDIAGVIGCLERTGRLGDTTIVVTGDYGVSPVHTSVRPNVFLDDVGLLVEARRGGLESWRAIARSNGGSAFVYARSEEDALFARSALEQAAADTRAFRVLSAQEMLRLGADPEAWFGLEAEPGYIFEDGIGRAPLAAAAVRAGGGYLPAREAMTTGLVAWGPGIRRGVRAPVLAQVDVAPTLARLLGIELGEVDGRVVMGLLDARALGSSPRRSEGVDRGP